MEEKKSLSLPFGKKIRCGNYYVLKHVRALGGKELKKLRNASGIPKDVQKHLQRGVLPYITVGTAVDSWNTSFVCGMTMYNAIDELEAVHDADGHYSFVGDTKDAFEYLVTLWHCLVTTVGDAEFQADCFNALHRFIDRTSDEQKEPLSDEENKKVMEESEADEKHRAAIVEMSNEIKKEDEGQSE